MPYEVAYESGILRVRLYGRVTSADLTRLATEAREIEASFAVTPDRLVDLTEVIGFDTHESELEHFAEARRRVRFPNSFRSAMVAPRPLLFGLARRFQILLMHPQVTVAVFNDMASAESWLASDNPGPPP